jgi:hypothetical protein
VKKDYKKYPHARDEHGKPLEILSTFGKASGEADAKAFAALMRHIKDVDSKQQTVVMIQVENEMGVIDNLGRAPWGKEISENPGNARRDFCDQANTAYNGLVPKELIDYLMQHKDSLFPELYKIWKANGFITTGSWEEIFGKSEFRREMKDWKFYSYYTEELFSAWNYARYAEKVTAAGKKEYAIPMYVNAWLKQPFSYWPGRYPSGGPLPQMLDIWRAAVPSIDFLAPDIYMDDFNWACQEYARSGNPLFIPETRGGDIGAARVFYVFGEFNAGCFAPFGIDNDRFLENDALDWAIDSGCFRSVEHSLNICDQRVIEGSLVRASVRGLGIIVKRPVANAPWRFNECPKGDYAEEYWRRWKTMDIETRGLNWQAVALRFTAFTPGVSSCIVGTTQLSHVQENIAHIESGPLNADHRVLIRKAFRDNDSGWWVGQV